MDYIILFVGEKGLEPSRTFTVREILSLVCLPISPLSRSLYNYFILYLIVGSIGLEPVIEEPKSSVLPITP